MLNRAAQLSEVPEYTRPAPLTDKTWDQYVPADEARGSAVAERMILELRHAPPEGAPLKILLAGHTGCGKSTELTRVRRGLIEEYLVKAVQVDDRYSLPVMDYRQLLFLCTQVLVETAAEKKVTLPTEQEELVESWFDEKEIEAVRSRGARVEVAVGGKISFLKALFARFEGKLFSGGETRDKVIKHIDERLDLLLGAMRVLVRALEEQIKPRRFLLVLENLDKLEDIDQAKRLFLDHRLQLLAVPFTVIYTCPIRLWYDAEGLHNYPARYLLPMIPVNEPPLTGNWNSESARKKAELGRTTLREIVHNRLSPALIAEEALDHLIACCGGVLRDLLYMVRNAALDALIRKTGRIELSHAQGAALRLRSDYANRLSPPSRSPLGATVVSYEDILKALGRVSEWPRTAPDQTPGLRLLLQSLCVLEYNGETWHDLHPLVREHLEIREQERRARGLSEVGTETTPGAGRVGS